MRASSGQQRSSKLAQAAKLLRGIVGLTGRDFKGWRTARTRDVATHTEFRCSPEDSARDRAGQCVRILVNVDGGDKHGDHVSVMFMFNSICIAIQ